MTAKERETIEEVLDWNWGLTLESPKEEIIDALESELATCERMAKQAGLFGMPNCVSWGLEHYPKIISELKGE